MKTAISMLSTIGLAVCIPVATAAPDDHTSELPPPFDRLIGLQQPLSKPQPGEWLFSHEEAGQSYREYMAGNPIRPTTRRRKICIQPLGQFTDKQRKIVQITAEYFRIYFGLPTQIKADLPLSLIPSEARRTHPEWGDQQVLSTYILREVLPPRLPRNATAMIAFTTSDLWPGKDWNFVFGQASLRDRVGVWSIYRNGDPAGGDEAFRLCLRRTIKTATHETGHMFSMAHCTLCRCNMCGSNSLKESDQQPLALCPHCLAKLCHCTAVNPVQRYIQHIAFFEKYGLGDEHEFAKKSLNALQETARPN